MLRIILPIGAAHKGPWRPRRGHQQLLEAALACSKDDVHFAYARNLLLCKAGKEQPTSCRLLWPAAGWGKEQLFPGCVGTILLI